MGSYSGIGLIKFTVRNDGWSEQEIGTDTTTDVILLLKYTWYCCMHGDKHKYIL